MPRFRDFIEAHWTLPAGTNNAITDVPGVHVGHVTLIEGEQIRTGVTAVLPHADNVFTNKVTAAVHTINGYGKAIGFEQIREFGEIETPILLTGTLNVWRVADALVSYMLRHNPDLRSVNPVVGECNDSFLNDGRGRHVTEEHVFAAIETAQTGTVAEGNVGAGTGTTCYGFKGGIGTASRQVKIEDHPTYTVGVLMQTNFGNRQDLVMCGIPVGHHFLESHLPVRGDGSVMTIIATDAPFDSRQLQRLAKRVAFGLGRTGTPGNNGSGDFVIAFSTARMEPKTRINDASMNPFFTAVVEGVEESVYNALVAARTMSGQSGHVLYTLPHDALRNVLKRYHLMRFAEQIQ